MDVKIRLAKHAAQYSETLRERRRHECWYSEFGFVFTTSNTVCYMDVRATCSLFSLWFSSLKVQYSHKFWCTCKNKRFLVHVGNLGTVVDNCSCIAIPILNACLPSHCMICMLLQWWNSGLLIQPFHELHHISSNVTFLIMGSYASLNHFDVLHLLLMFVPLSMGYPVQ